MAGRGEKQPGSRRLAMAAWACLVVALPAGVVAAASGLLGRSAGVPGAGWLAQVLCSRASLVCGGVVAGAAGLLVVIGGMMWAAGTPHRMRRRAQEGAVMLEFILVLPFALFLVLIMVQSSLVMGGNIGIHYAAFCAARTAVVAVPLNLEPLEPRNFVLGSADSSAKMLRIRSAAVWALMPMSCGGSDYPGGADGGTLAQGLGSFYSQYALDAPGWATDAAALGRRLAYADQYTTVELASPGNGESYGEHEDIRVDVTHTFYLSVPYADRLFASFGEGVSLGFAGSRGLVMKAHCRLTNEGAQDFIEKEVFPTK